MRSVIGSEESVAAVWTVPCGTFESIHPFFSSFEYLILCRWATDDGGGASGASRSRLHSGRPRRNALLGSHSLQQLHTE